MHMAGTYNLYSKFAPAPGIAILRLFTDAANSNFDSDPSNWVQFTRETRPQLWSSIDHCQISQPDPAPTPPCTYRMAVPEAVNRPLLRSLNLYRNATWDDPSATCKEFPPVALAAPGFTYPWFGALIMMSSVPIMIVPTATSGAVI